MSTKTMFDGVIENLLAAGEKLADASLQLSTIGLDATRKTLHSKVALASALVDVGAEQLRDVDQLTTPAAILQRQMAAGEAVGEKLKAYAESLREIGSEAQSGYLAAMKEFAARLGLKAA